MARSIFISASRYDLGFYHLNIGRETIQLSFEELLLLVDKLQYVIPPQGALMQSPLELSLGLALNRVGLVYDSQHIIDLSNGEWIPGHGSMPGCTTVDFYLESSNVRLCVYVDGFKVHHSREGQVMHDNAILARLQKLGYLVVRYSTFQIEKDMGYVISNIKLLLE